MLLQVLPRSALQPYYKFTVPTAFVHRDAKHLVGKTVVVANTAGKKWTARIFARQSRQKIEYVLQVLQTL